MSEKKDSKKEQEKKEDKNTEAKVETPQEKKAKTIKFIIFTSILLIIFLGLVFIPQLIQKQKFEDDTYNNFQFIEKEDGFWYTLVQKGDQPYWIPFYYHPTELEDIPIEPDLRSKFFEMADNQGKIFITLDPDSESNKIVIAGVEISRITGGRFGLLNVPTSSAFTKQPTTGSAETGTPIVTCENSNNQTMVIWIALSKLNIAYSQNYCVILEAKTYDDMIRVADRTMYHLLGIMD